MTVILYDTANQEMFRTQYYLGSSTNNENRKTIREIDATIRNDEAEQMDREDYCSLSKYLGSKAREYKWNRKVTVREILDQLGRTVTVIDGVSTIL